MGASLAEGYVEDHTVTCPGTLGVFVSKTELGRQPRVKVAAFEVRVEGDDVQVKSMTDTNLGW